MADPLVSVIIPCYNAERYIGDAIRSALAQTYQPIEVIVIDDGSTDGSTSVARSFGEIVRCESIKNSGVSAARNTGLAMAHGELIQFLDADDLLHSQKLERMVPVALKQRDSMVFCMAGVSDMTTGKRLRSWGALLESDTDPIAYVFSTFVGTANPLHLKGHLSAVRGFRSEMRLWEDPDLYFRLAASGLRFHQLREELVTFRQVEGSLSTRDPRQSLCLAKGFASDAIELLRQQGGLTEARAEAIAG